jgi:hypothetical protein
MQALPIDFLRLATLVLALALIPGVAGAQQVDGGTEPPAEPVPAVPAVAVVSVHSNLADGILFAGDQRLGRIGSVPYFLPPGAVQLRLVEADAEVWNPRVATADLDLAAGDTLTVTLNVPYRYRVETIPVGAKVLLRTGDTERRLGTAPLVYESVTPLAGEIVAQRGGFLEERIALQPGTPDRLTLVLRPIDGYERTQQEIGLRPVRSNAWIDYAAAGVALAAGAVAVHYKFKADVLYDEYVRTTDPASRPTIRQYDTYSTVALGAMQAGLGVLAIRFILR